MQKHILLVDSDAESQDRLSQTLRQCNYRVSTACSCAESLAAIENEKPDCVVFDVELDGPSGTIMYSRLRRNPATRLLPAVVCTAVGPRPVNYGTGIPVVEKNCSPEVLLSTVAAAMA